MHVGMTTIFQNPEGNDGDPKLDAAVIEQEYRMAGLAEELGFDSLWGVEHHLNGYAMCPDPLKFLMYFAARTKKIRLGTMVVVTPWRTALRFAEDVSVLDQVSGGRAIIGMGRGVAKREFDAFGLDMNLSRDTLIETIECLQMGLETGRIAYDGKVIKQQPAMVRPAPVHSFNGRLYGSANASETYPLFAKLGIGLLFIPGGKSWEEAAVDLETYRRVFRDTHGYEAPGPIMAGWVFVDEDGERARDIGPKMIAKYMGTALDHYDMGGEHMKSLRGYEYYAKNTAAMQQAGITMDDVTTAYVGNHVYGTPDECFEKVKLNQEKIGAAGFLGVFRYAGMPEDEALRNQKLFAEKVMPRLKAYKPELDIGVSERTLMAAE